MIKMWETYVIEINPIIWTGIPFFSLICISGFCMSGCFIFGIRKKRYMYAEKVISVASTLFFIMSIICLNLLILGQMAYLFETGGKPVSIIYELRAYFSRHFLLGILMLYQMVLILILKFMNLRTNQQH